MTRPVSTASLDKVKALSLERDELRQELANRVTLDAFNNRRVAKLHGIEPERTLTATIAKAELRAPKTPSQKVDAMRRYVAELVTEGLLPNAETALLSQLLEASWLRLWLKENGAKPDAAEQKKREECAQRALDAYDPKLSPPDEAVLALLDERISVLAEQYRYAYVEYAASLAGFTQANDPRADRHKQITTWENELPSQATEFKKQLNRLGRDVGSTFEKDFVASVKLAANYTAVHDRASSGKTSKKEVKFVTRVNASLRAKKLRKEQITESRNGKLSYNRNNRAQNLRWAFSETGSLKLKPPNSSASNELRCIADMIERGKKYWQQRLSPDSKPREEAAPLRCVKCKQPITDSRSVRGMSASKRVRAPNGRTSKMPKTPLRNVRP